MDVKEESNQTSLAENVQINSGDTIANRRSLLPPAEISQSIIFKESIQKYMQKH